MSKLVIEHKNIPLLGAYDKAERLITWSERHPEGAQHVKSFKHGLQLGFIARGSSPRIYIHWNQARFRDFLKKLPFSPDQLSFTEYGICVSFKNGRTLVSMPGVGASKVRLWDSNIPFCKDNEDANVNWLGGTIELTDEGPLFFTQIETQQELQEATAVAQFRVKKTKAPSNSTALPSTPPLSDKTRAYLLQDALLNMSLQAG